MNMMKTVPTSVAFLIMVLSGIGVLWYIQLLWAFSIVLIAIRKIERDRLWKLGWLFGWDTLSFPMMR